MAENTENLQKYEELFAHRFTSEDREYQQYQSRPNDPPPIVEDWNSRRGGSYRGRDNRYCSLPVVTVVICMKGCCTPFTNEFDQF